MLAPLAFFVAATVLILLIQNALNAEGAGAPETRAAATNATTEAANSEDIEPTTSETQPARKRRFYRVRAGDTLESIAERHNTTVEELLELNPQIDPLALTVGQRLRIA